MEQAPFGTWPSPLTAAVIARGAIRIGDLRVDGDDLYWLESRPSEAGRVALVRWRDGDTAEVTPRDANVRTRVHEYGGASFQVAGGVTWWSRFGDQRLLRQDGPGDPPRPITPEPSTPGALRYGDADVAPDGTWLVCVRERHDDGGVHNDVVALPADGDGPIRVLATGTDFVAAPRLSPDGTRLAWMAWDHPYMPWDASEVRVADVTREGIGAFEVVAGGPDGAAGDPTWLPGGDLCFTTDVSGYLNVHRWDGTAERPVTDVAADIGRPHWTLGTSHLAVLDADHLACVLVERAVHRLAVLDLASGDLAVIDQPLSEIRGVEAAADGIVLVGAGPDVEQAVVRVDPTDGAATFLRRVDTPGLTGAWAPPVEAITFPTPDGAEAHAFHYPPTNPDVEPPPDERPPLVVSTHGGPTAASSSALSPAIAYWTSRGFAVVDVNYRGSSGYGRAYRDALRGNWGVHDVTDAIAAARYLADRGDVDPDRMVIRGGSAGGYTTLGALVTEDHPFAAGCDLFGVADLGLLAAHTHKFEARYLDQMVGPADDVERYRERSPITHLGRLRTPVIVIQGDEDEVVPPEQSEAVVAAARRAGVPHAYLLFHGEQHGFRQAANIVRALEGELAFYGEILGFRPADDIPPLDVVRP